MNNNTTKWKKQNNYVSKLNLISIKVYHNVFGEGKIIKQEMNKDNSYIEVQFVTCSKLFIYPNCFINGYLIIKDDSINKKVNEDIEAMSLTQAELANKEYIEQEEKREKNRVMKEVRYEDFVIIKNSFYCRSQKHTIKDITAIIHISKFRGGENIEEVAAWYCEECDLFYIDKDEYYRLKMKGTLICKNNYEEIYYKNKNKYISKLNQQSILMQYGYNVSNEVGLSDIERQSILALLIDKNILTKIEILEYIDFFIKQRENQIKDYASAIKKWQTDAKFIKEYRNDEYTKIDVRGVRNR